MHKVFRLVCAARSADTSSDRASSRSTAARENDRFLALGNIERAKDPFGYWFMMAVCFGLDMVLFYCAIDDALALR
jgi:hypothetical protein